MINTSELVTDEPEYFISVSRSLVPQEFQRQDESSELENKHQGSLRDILCQLRSFPSTFCVLLAVGFLWSLISLLYYCVMMNSTYFNKLVKSTPTW